MSPKIFIEAKKSKVHGFGVFATQDIKKGTVIELCPYTIVKGNFKGKLNNYIFDFDGKKKSAVVFLHGSLYNHSKNPNVTYCFDTEADVYEFTALRIIAKGEECFIDYGAEYWKHRKK